MREVVWCRESEGAKVPSGDDGEKNKCKIYKTTDCSLKAELMESPWKQS